MLGAILIVIIVIAALATILMAMRARDNQLWSVYLIKKGKRKSESSLSLFPTTFKFGPVTSTLRFAAMFCDGCDRSADTKAIHDLFGVSYGFDPNYRSVRIGWRYNSNLKVMGLYLCVWINNRRFYRSLVNIALYEQVDFTLFRSKERGLCIVEVKCEDGRRVTDSAKIDDAWINWKIFPSLNGGGAICDTKILIRKT